jgi:ATP-dependent NAD(P)H-hydrate dehydratase
MRFSLGLLMIASLAVASATQSLHPSNLTQILRSVVPKFDHHLHKGQMGRIGIIGGSADYTGAPYYAAQSSLYFGADLATVFSAKEALIPIKSYSPELMVTALYDTTEIETLEDQIISSQLMNTLRPHLPRLHSLVIGPGLGRHPKLLANLAPSIRMATEANIP